MKSQTIQKLQLAAASTLLLVSTAAFAADDHFERTLNVSAQPDLYVRNGSGNITVHAGGANQIRIVGHIHAGWSSFGNVDGRITKIVQNPPISQEANSVHVGESNDHDLFRNISIDYDITAPADVALNLRSGSGDVIIDQVGRFLTTSTGSGNVRAHGIHGSAEMSSGSGDIELEQSGPGDIKLKAGSGNIKVRNFEGNLAARTGSGEIQAEGKLTSGANLSSGSGNIRLHLTPDARFNLEASTGSGDIRVNYPGAPEQGEHSRHHLTGPVNGGGVPLEIHTGSGDVVIDGH